MTYTVKSGDSLSKIAGAIYGNESLYQAIANANHILDVNRIYPGQVLIIPEIQGWPFLQSTAPATPIPKPKFVPTQIPAKTLVVSTASTTPGQTPGTTATVAPEKPMSTPDKLMLGTGIALALGAVAAVVMRKRKRKKVAKA